MEISLNPKKVLKTSRGAFYISIGDFYTFFGVGTDCRDCGGGKSIYVIKVQQISNRISTRQQDHINLKLKSSFLRGVLINVLPIQHLPT
jgi:hypothetical protein